MNETTPWTPTNPPTEGVNDELERLHEKLDRLMNAVAILDRRRDELEDIVRDVMPAANGAVRVATHHLWELEQDGTLDLAREAASALGVAASTIDPDDLRALGAGAGRALHTVRTLTGPEVAAVSERTVAALQKARTGKPPGLFSLLWRLRRPHVRRGMWATLEILEGLGEGAHPVPVHADDRVPRARVGRPAAAPPRAAPRPAAVSGAPVAGAPTPPALAVAGRTVALDPDGFLNDPADWDRDVAVALAEAAGIGPLTDEHWNVLDFCRRDAGQSGAAPGLRRITKELDIPPADMYRLFPKGPGTLAARIAGLYKPKSCV
ncbi:MAG: TusE/DsrC/DsvC family sulfur relay protein [Gemmatimonadetes bacterium]|nr:TusE/DsrC/DsvC family sulfur relay protein [Gemmatimonadota bacterium]